VNSNKDKAAKDFDFLFHLSYQSFQTPYKAIGFCFGISDFSDYFMTD
jgi:hypothetical protein